MTVIEISKKNYELHLQTDEQKFAKMYEHFRKQFVNSGKDKMYLVIDSSGTSLRNKKPNITTSPFVDDTCDNCGEEVRHDQVGWDNINKCMACVHCNTDLEADWGN